MAEIIKGSLKMLFQMRHLIYWIFLKRKHMHQRGNIMTIPYKEMSNRPNYFPDVTPN